MAGASRREFLGKIGQGMLLAGLGTSLAQELGLGAAFAEDASPALNFGTLEPLVAMMQETSPGELVPRLLQELKSGTELKTLVTAGALANARTFGGHDYIGFHTFMALAPAYRIALDLPEHLRPLPVIKVLYRNTNRIQEFGGRAQEVLHEISSNPVPSNTHAGEYIQSLARNGDIEAADRAFASLSHAPIGEAFNHLQYELMDEVDVHRIVLAWRAWDTRELAGEEWGHMLLRQSVHYCARTEAQMIERKHQKSPIRTLLPALLDQYQLLSNKCGQKVGDDAWLEGLAKTIFRGTREQAADAVAQTIREGYSPESIGEAISLAANMLVLHDPGRPEKWANSDKPVGSCHGDSVGVHASDAANAWRNIVRVSDHRNTVAGLIVGAFHTAGQSDRSNDQPYPFAEHLDAIQGDDPARLLGQLDEAIRAKEQFRSAALAARLGTLGSKAEPILEILRKYATSEDGALHAEKYFNTVRDEYDSIRAPFRWGQIVALARVTASEYGHRSPGYEEARKLMKV